MRALLRTAAWLDWLNDGIGRAVGWLAALLVIVGVVNVVGRYAGSFIGMQLSSNSLLEAQTYIYSLIFLLGAAHLLRREGHIRVDILYAGRTLRTRAWIDIAGSLLLLLPFCGLGLFLSLDYTAQSWADLERSPNPGGLPRYPIKTIIPVAFGLLFLQGLSELVKRIAWLRGVPGATAPGADSLQSSCDDREGKG